MGLIGSLIIGGLAGFFAGKFMRGDGFGVIGNIIVGIIGGAIGGFSLGLLGFAGDGMIAQLITAFVGAVILLWIVGIVKK